MWFDTHMHNEIIIEVINIGIFLYVMRAPEIYSQ